MVGLSDKQEQDASKAAKARWAKAQRDFEGQWREVPSLPGYYASPDGRVRSKHKVLVAHPTKTGHLMVAPSVEGKQRPEAVHRMVCEAFHGPCPDGMECRHVNGDPADNRAENLAWGTRLENQRDRLRHATCNSGERNGRAKITADLAKAVYSAVKAGSPRDLVAARFGVTRTQVGLIAGGFRWNSATGSPRRGKRFSLQK